MAAVAAMATTRGALAVPGALVSPVDLTVDFRSFYRVFLGRDLGTVKSDIVSNKYIHNEFVRI